MANDRWVSGPQTLPNSPSDQFAGTAKFALGVGAVAGFAAFPFSPKTRGIDLITGAVRAVEEYSPGKVFRTFQVSHMLSPFETPSRQARYFSPLTLRNLQQTSSGRAWIDHVSRLTGKDITAPNISSQGFRYESGQLKLGQAGNEVLLRHASIIRSPTGASPTFQTGYLRSLAGGPVANIRGMGKAAASYEASFANRTLSQQIAFSTLGGEAQEALFITGGQSRFQSATRWLSGYGTSLTERLNQLSRAPFEMEPFRSVFSKIPLLNKTGLGVVPSSGLKTLGKLTAKLGIGGTAAYLGYQQLDYYARESSLFDGTLLSEGITAGLATAWTRTSLALSKLSNTIGLHSYREAQEDIAPGSTDFSRLLAFPLMGGLGGLGIAYGQRIFRQANFQRLGLDVSEASIAASAQSSFFKKAIYGTSVSEDITSRLAPQTISLLENQTAKKVSGWQGRIARRLALRQDMKGFTGQVLGKLGQLTPGKIKTIIGAGIGAALIAPFIPGALISDKRPEELEALYSGDAQVPVRKGAFWEFGRSAWEGGRVLRYQDHWYPRLLARAKERSIWGDAPPGPIERWWTEETTYELEQRHYKSRPYPVSGTFGEDIPFIGPVIAATLGRLIKPARPMHTDQWMRTGPEGETETLRMPLGFGEREEIPELGEVGPGSPISPYGIKGTLGEQAYRATEMVGLPGFTMTAIKEAITGEADLFAQEQQLESARRMFGAERSWWDRELGGLAGTTELLRRLYPHRRRQIPLYNPIPNQMPDWLPGSGAKSLDFLTGDPYAKIPLGEERLPGPGYAVLNPEVEGLDPSQYPLFHRFKILADIAPYTDKFHHTVSQVRGAVNRGDFSEEQTARVEEIITQVQSKKEKKQFSPYKYREGSPTLWSQILEEPKEEPGWFKSTVGSYWETLTHNAETPLEYLTPVSPGAKLVHQRTALEDYARTQVFGTKNAFWGHPVRDFFTPFFTSLKDTLGFEGIPSHIKERRGLEEYFDILKWVKFSHLERAARFSGDTENAALYREKTDETLFGVNPYTFNYSHLYRALPRRERDYFKDFESTDDTEERAEILKLVPENEEKFYLARWKLQDAQDMKKAIDKGLLTEEQEEIARQEIEVTHQEQETEGFPKSQELWQEYLETRLPGESYPDWYRRTKLLAKALDGKNLPGPDWVGFCITKNQPIINSNRLYVSAKNVKVGDRLITHKGTRIVKSIYTRKINEQIHKLSVRGNQVDSLHVTSNHPLLAIQAIKCPYNSKHNSICSTRSTSWKCSFCTDHKYLKYTPQWISAKDITNDTFLLYPLLKHSNKDPIIDLNNEADWNQINCIVDKDTIYPKSGIRKPMKRFVSIDESVAWLIGYYLAEGNVWKTGTRLRGIQFTAHIKEIKILELAKSIIKQSFGLEGRIIKRYRKTGNSAYLVVASSAFALLVNEWAGRYCDKKKPPYWLEDITHNAQNALLDGLNTGDASKDRRSRLIITNYNLCIMAKRIWESNNIPASVRKLGRQNKKPQFEVSPVAYPLNVMFFDKYVAYRVSRNSCIDYNGDVFDFEVENDHSYLCPIAILHNSPAVQLEDVKLKIIEQRKENPYEYDIWPGQMREAARKPYLDEAAESLMDEDEMSIEEVQKTIRDILGHYEIENPHVVVSEVVGGKNNVNIRLKENRAVEAREIMKRQEVA